MANWRIVLSSRYFCSQRVMSASKARMRSSLSLSRCCKEVTFTLDLEVLIACWPWDCHCKWKRQMVSLKKQTKKKPSSQFVRWDLPVVPWDSSVPALVGCEASSPEPPFSHMQPEAGPKHFEVSPPSPHMPSSYAALPPVAYSVSEQTLEPALAPRGADTTPLQKFSDTATHAQAFLVLADAPHLNIPRERDRKYVSYFYSITILSVLFLQCC